MTDPWKRRDWSRGVESVRQDTLVGVFGKVSVPRNDKRSPSGVAVPCVKNGNKTGQSTKETYPTRKVLPSISARRMLSIATYSRQDIPKIRHFRLLDQLKLQQHS